MIVLDMPQGSHEWQQARLGIPTASAYDRILTPAKLQYASGAQKYLRELLGEWLTGHPVVDFGNPYTERGTGMEEEARKAYEFAQDVDVQRVGFILRDDRATGCSPDGLVGSDGGVEIKCPGIVTHLGYMMNPASLVADYTHQIQGSLYVTGREWWDIFAFCPGMPDVCERVTPNDAYQTALDAALDRFIGELNVAKERFAEHRVEPPKLPWAA